MIRRYDIVEIFRYVRKLSIGEQVFYLLIMVLLPGFLLTIGTIISRTSCDRLEPNYVVCQQTGGFLFGAINLQPGEFRLKRAAWIDAGDQFVIVYLQAQNKDKYYLFDSTRKVRAAQQTVTQMNNYMAGEGDERLTHWYFKPWQIIVGLGSSGLLALFFGWLLHIHVKESRPGNYL